jgi:hypothetical protein
MGTAQSMEEKDETRDQSLIPTLPEMVEFDGGIWKRTIAGTGQNYFFNVVSKDTRWDLPEVFVVVDPVTMKPWEEGSDEEIDPFEDAESRVVENVSPTSPWRRVCNRNTETYYYNFMTLETSWLLPASDEA